jgi:hypothetical protein
VEPVCPGSVPFLRSDGDFWIPTPTTPNILSPPPPAPPPAETAPPPAPTPVIPPTPGRPVSADEAGDGEATEAEEEDDDDDEETALAVAETGSVSDGAGSDGLESVVKHGPKRLRQLPFFFFFTLSSQPPMAPARPGPTLDVEGWARLKPTPLLRLTVSGGLVRLVCEFSYSLPPTASRGKNN